MSTQVVIYPQNYNAGITPATILTAQAVTDPLQEPNFMINFPAVAPSDGCVMVSDADGNLTWTTIDSLFDKYLESGVIAKKILASKAMKNLVNKLISEQYEVLV